MKRIIVKFYFDNEIRAIGFTLLLFSYIIGGMAESWLIFFLTVIIGLILFATHYEVLLNKKESYYKRSLNFMGIRFGKKKSFQAINSCQIVKGRYTDLYMVGPFGMSTEGEMYHAFIEFSNGDLVQIGKSKDRSKLLKKINFFRFDYMVNIEEYEDNTLITNKLNNNMMKSYPKNKMGGNLIIMGIVTSLFAAVYLFQDLTSGSLSILSILVTSLSIVAIVLGIIKMRTQTNNSEHS